MSTDAVDRLGAGRSISRIDPPAGVHITLHELPTFDGARVMGVLHQVAGARTVVTLMHPRQSLTHHPMIDWFLRMGLAVWTQDTRSPNNDVALIHEQAILDVAAGQIFLQEHGFDSRLLFGHSGGGTLMAYYIEQAALPPEFRIDVTPAGRPLALAGAQMPMPQAALFLAPHPGQGQVLLSCIDPSVARENDPLAVTAALDMYEPGNGFKPPPTSSCYTAEFLARYRQAQADRMRRIDTIARERAAEAAEARVRFGATHDERDHRIALAPRLLTTYRTDADPRYVDLSLDPGDRPYGSLFGRRPDLTNYGLVGFGRFTTPDAWLSTWSGFTSNAVFQRCAPGITVPTMYLEFSGDQAAPAEQSHAMYTAIASADKTRATVAGQHFGQPLRAGDPTGYEAAAALLQAWLHPRFELATTSAHRP